MKEIYILNNSLLEINLANHKHKAKTLSNEMSA